MNVWVYIKSVISKITKVQRIAIKFEFMLALCKLHNISELKSYSPNAKIPLMICVPVRGQMSNARWAERGSWCVILLNPILRLCWPGT